MEDWLGIILGILFILGPALLEKGNRKKKRGQRHERQLPQQEEAYGPDPVLRPEMTEVPQPEIRPVYVPVSSDEPVCGSDEVVLHDEQAVQQPAYQILDTVPEREKPQPVRQILDAVPEEAVPAPDAKVHAGRKRRINGRDMIVYSEILKPKF